MTQSTLEAAGPDRDVTERLSRYAVSRDPRALWPSLTDAALASARRDIGRVVRAVLAHTPATLDADDPSAVYALKIAAYTTGTSALLGRWVEDGLVRASAAVQRVMAQQLEQGRRRAARLEREVLPAIDALLTRGITPIALKGFHTSREYYEEPGMRASADVDLLVPPERLADAESALRAAGFRPNGPLQARPYKRHWIGVHVDSRTFSVEGIDERNRWEIDLHVSFSRRIGFHDVQLDPECKHVAPFIVATRSLLAPTQPLLVLALAAQISMDLKAMRLMRAVDIVRVVRTHRAAGTLDWDTTLSQVSRTKSASLVYPGLAVTEQLAPGTVDAEVLAFLHRESSWPVRSVVAGLTPLGGSSDETHLMTQFMWARGPTDVIRMCAHLVGGNPFSIRGAVFNARVFARRLRAGSFSFWRPDESAT